MLREYIVELAQNPKVAISVSAASAGISAGTKFLNLVGEVLPTLSMIAAFCLTLIIAVAHVCDILRKNREHKIALIEAELRIAKARKEGQS